jgi:hypothetical protein
LVLPIKLTVSNEQREAHGFHAVPIVPFTLRNERIQRCHYFLFAEVRDQFFKLQLNLGESSGCEVARGSHSSRR